MTIPDEIGRFLDQKAPRAYCDDCIRIGLSHTNKHPLAAAALATTSDYSRLRGACSSCQRRQNVTRAVRYKGRGSSCPVVPDLGGAGSV